MRFLLPPKPICEEFLRTMMDVFDEPRLADVRAAFVPVCAFFRIATPRFCWQSKSQRRRMYAHMRHDKGRGVVIALTKPRDWVRQRKRKTPRQWAFDSLHELDHALKIPREEARADAFARAFLDRAEA